MNVLSKTVISLISAGIIAITGILLYVYWPAITGTINDSQYLTPEQGQDLYNKGYSDGNKSEEDQLAQIAYYRELTDEYYVQVGLLNNEISVLNSEIVTKNNSITDLTNIRNANMETIETLTAAVNDNESTITTLNQQVTDLTASKNNLEMQLTTLSSDMNNKETIITGLNSQVQDLQSEINAKQNQITNLNAEVESLQNQINTYVNDYGDNITVIENLRSQVENCNNEIALLQNQIANKNTEIQECNNQIAFYTSQINDLQYEINDKAILIASLNNQISNYELVNSQLEQTNQSNLNTISSLNNQIVSLNSQITYLSSQMQDSSTSVSSLTERIAELENSLAYYEQYISNLESDEQAIVTFEFDRSVYAIQVIPKNTYASISEPTSTERVIFNGWMVDGNFVDVSEYLIQENTKFVADVTHYYDVVFKYQDEIIQSDFVVEGDCAYAYGPSIDGYQFEGWTLDGLNIVNPEYYPITQDTVFIAKYIQLFGVSFYYEYDLVAFATVGDGGFTSGPEISSTETKLFNGWKINGVIVDVNTYAIFEDTTFEADITYKYFVDFFVDDNIYSHQLVIQNNYPMIPDNPIKDGYEFDGWSLNRYDVVNPTSIIIDGDTMFYAVFTPLYDVVFESEGTSLLTQTVREGEIIPNMFLDDSTYKIFNGWMVNGVLVDVANYPIYENTIFEANFTYRYNVVFRVDAYIFNTQTVTEGEYALVPNTPVKTGYTFVGWSFDGESLVDIETFAIYGDSYFDALFTITLYEVLFFREDTRIDRQLIEHGGFAMDNDVIDTEYVKFNGWKVDNVFVNVNTYPITKNTVFVADFTYYYEVKFKTDNVVHSRQVIAKNGYVTLPADPQKPGYVFDGWSLDQITMINPLDVAITQDITFWGMYTLIPYGLFDENDNVIKVWDLLISEHYFDIASGTLKKGDYRYRTEMAGVLKIPDSITKIGSNCFYECGNLTKIELPNTITEIGGSAFSRCYGLRELTIPNSVTTIYGAAFANCDSLECIIIPSSVTKLYAETFLHCDSLKYVYIPSTVTEITCSSPAFSLFHGSPGTTCIYLGANPIPSGYQQYWNCISYHYISSNNYDQLVYCPVKLGYTLERFLYEVSQL